MSFASWQFAVLTAATFVLYYAHPLRRFQIVILVAASIIFYSWDQYYLLPLLLATVLGTYACLIATLRGLRAAMWAGIIGNLAALAFFKYKFLFVQPSSAVHTGNGVIDALIALPLPIGISFFVFHNISMLVDFSKARPEPDPSLADAFLYIIFFPQLVSGPITRARSFFPQMEPKRLYDIAFVDAGRWIIGGYFLKLFCANNLNQMTSWMAPEVFPRIAGGDRVLLLFLYSFQIFADFAGYSAIAVGLGLLFGYRLPVNFRNPYISRSFSEFWTRWHVSLSMWLRTYLYIPLGGNRHGEARTYLNLMTVMGLGGLWHGAGLSYLVWGLAHGLFLVAERPFLRAEEHLYRRAGWLGLPYLAMRVALVFVLVSAAWLFFRLPTFSDALAYAGGMWPWDKAVFQFHTNLYWLAALYACPVILLHLLGFISEARLFKAVEPMLYGVLVFLAVVEAGPDSAFIYFQF